MKRTLNLIIKTVWNTCRMLPVNWLLYSLSLVTFNVLWVLLPENVSIAIMNRDAGILFLSGLIGLTAAMALFFNTYLSNNAWMQINKVRYAILLRLLEASLRIPFSKTLNPDYLAYLDKARLAAMNPSIGIGSVMSYIYELLGILLSAIGLFGIVSRISPLLGMFVLLTVLISFGLNSILHRHEEKEWDLCANPKRKHEKVYDHLMEEALGKDIRLFSLTAILDNYGRDFSKEITDIQRSSNKEKLKYQLLLLINDFMRNVVVYIWLAVYISTERMDIGSFLTYALGILQLSLTVQSILTHGSTIYKEMHRFSNYWVIVDEADRCIGGLPEKPLHLDPQKSYTIKFEHVCFTYPNAETPAMQDVSFTINQGCQTALVGLNGAGKSTLIKLLCRLYVPDSGTIRINGVDIQTIPSADYYNLLSVVLQTGTVLPYSIQDNITFSESFSPDAYERAVTLSDFKPIQDSLPDQEHTFLSHTMDSGGIDLSGGEKQKLLLSRAICQGGRIFLLDEPAGAMDPIAEETLYHSYKRITDHCTSLIISHQLSFVSVCDHIIMLENGKIAEQGTHSELMETKGKYYEIYMEQKKQYQK